MSTQHTSEQRIREAAPDMYEALSALFDAEHAEHQDPFAKTEAWRKVRAALDKAERCEEHEEEEPTATILADALFTVCCGLGEERGGSGYGYMRSALIERGMSAEQAEVYAYNCGRARYYRMIDSEATSDEA